MKPSQFYLILLRVLSRLFSLFVAYFAYLLQFIALFFRQKKIASSLLSLCARRFLNCLGGKVVIHSDLDWNRPGKGFVHIYNHQNPLDVFVIQGFLGLPSITTAGSHLGVILPFFDIAARNSGHVLLDHMSSVSRRKSFYRSFEVMSEFGQMIIAPNGSLLTSIHQRASRSAQVLAKRFSTSIAPWFFAYENAGIESKDLYSPRSIFFKRIIAPEAKIICTLRESDLKSIPVDLDKNLFESCVISFYASKTK